MDYIYIIFLLLVILASLFVYFIFGKGVESMVTIGSDLTAPIDIPGATYSGPRPNNKEKGINGYGLEPPQGYYKIEVGGGVWKMKPIIPTGYIINPSDNTKLIVDPKNKAVSSAISYYKNTSILEVSVGNRIWRLASDIGNLLHGIIGKIKVQSFSYW